MSEETTINGIIAELEKPQNRNLLFAFLAFDRDKQSLEGNANKSFVWGFSQGFGKVASFEEYADTIRSLEMQLKGTILELEETVDMSKSYDNYLDSIQKKQDESGLTESLAKQWDEIIDTFNNNGWSGAYYGYICRKVEAALRMKYANDN